MLFVKKYLNVIIIINNFRYCKYFTSSIVSPYNHCLLSKMITLGSHLL